MRNINFIGLIGLCPNKPVPVKQKDFRDDSELNRICQLVYSADERTGLPSSDLSVLFSDSVPSEIADWVRKNLQTPHELGGQRSVYGSENVDDDTIIQLTRNNNESQSAYIQRVNDYLINLNKGD